jgi:hypothetical protein
VKRLKEVIAATKDAWDRVHLLLELRDCFYRRGEPMDDESVKAMDAMLQEWPDREACRYLLTNMEWMGSDSLPFKATIEKLGQNTATRIDGWRALAGMKEKMDAAKRKRLVLLSRPN